MRLLHPLTLAAGLLFLTAVLVAFAVVEGDFPEELTDVSGLVHQLLTHFGAPGSLVLLYAEESGVPLPVPGDVYVAYLGRIAGGEALRWTLAWVAIVCVVVAGSTNLYLIARRWGGRLVSSRLAPALHISPDRVTAAERLFVRWGAIAIIFGRHVPGLRVPITLVAGISRVPYRIFAPSVAVSTAVWAAIWLWLGSHFGRAVGAFIATHAFVATGVGVAIIVMIAVILIRLWTSIPPASDSISDRGEYRA